jgi:fibronectin-binding autotransporter adhesin
LLKWTTGPAPAVSLGFLAGAGGHLTTNGNEIDLIIDDPPFIWTDATANNIWDSSSVNWEYSGGSTAWTNGHYALLDDTAGGTGAVTLSGSISPTNATINNSALTFAITSSPGNVIAGAGGVTKNGNGTLTLPGGANTYTGVTTVGGGILGVAVLANAGAASDIGAANNGGTNLVLSGGGTLQYTGVGVSMNRLFTVGQNGGTIDNQGGSLVFNNSNGQILMSGNGPRTLTLSGLGSADTMAPSIINHPAGTGLKKTGPGTWILTGTNTYAGGTTLLEGTLQIGTGGTSGTIGNGNISSAAGTGIDFVRTGTLTVPGSISGGCGVTNDGTGTVILANNNGYTGGTVINAGTLQVGTGGGAGSLSQTAPILNNSLLVFNTSGSYTYGNGANGVISGTGNLIVQGGGFIKALGANTYSGWTRIDANTIFQPFQGQDGGLVSPVVTNNGTLRIETQNQTAPGFAYAGPIVGTGRLQIGANNQNIGIVTLSGSNTYSGGTFIGDSELDLGDGATAGGGSIVGNVVFTNNFTIAEDHLRTLMFNRPVGDDFTFSGTITTNFPTAVAVANSGVVRLGSLALGGGGANMTLTGNNTYGAGTIVDIGQLTIGNGGTSGSVGFGPVTLNSANQLLINRSGTLSIPGAITGVGGVTTIGSATVTLSSLGSTYTGQTIISNGTLVVSSLGGDLNVEGGTVMVQSTFIAANLNVPGNMNIDSGTVVATLNKTTPQSNTTYTVTGNITYTGGKLTLLTADAQVTPGDKFFIFNKPVTGGGAIPILSPGCTVQNNLAVDGSVTVLTSQPLPTALTASVVGGTQFNASWPAAWTGGVHLQGQTNTLAQGLRNTNWVDVAGTTTTNVFSSPVNTNRAVFYRMVIP